MQKFTDADGQDWVLSADFGTFIKVKMDTGVDLALIEEPVLLENESKDCAWASQPGVVRLHQDLQLTFAIIYSMCQEQADSRSMSNIDFAKQLVKGGKHRDAFIAFWRELRDFFHDLQKDYLVKMIEKYHQATKAMSRRVEREGDERIAWI